MADEWFRSTAWDKAARADFEARLSRARSTSRPQYLRIKGLALHGAGRTDDAVTLWTRVIEDYPESLDAASAREFLADTARSSGDLDLAQAHYRALLNDRPALNATTGLAELSLAEVLIEGGTDDGYREARQLLDKVLERDGALLFNKSRFRWEVTSAVLAGRVGDGAVRRSAASAALELVGRGPQFARHPTVGLVEANEATIRWLQWATGGVDALGPVEPVLSSH
jgi:tetratricopeptide (TPR) repeat protein